MLFSTSLSAVNAVIHCPAILSLGDKLGEGLVLNQNLDSVIGRLMMLRIYPSVM